MADENNGVIKRIVWCEVFSFPRIFRGFKMAAHPSKLMLGVLLLLLLFVGGWLLDSLWTGAFDQGVQPGAITAYVRTDGETYDDRMDAWKEGRLRQSVSLYVGLHNDLRTLNAYKRAADLGAASSYASRAFNEMITEDTKKNRLGEDYKSLSVSDELTRADNEDLDYDDYLDKAGEAFEEELDILDEVLEDLDKRANKLIDDAKASDDVKEEARDDLKRALSGASQGVTRRKIQFRQAVQDIKGVGIFEQFMQYQVDCVHNAVMAVRYLNFTGGMSQYCRFLEARRIPSVSVDAESGLPDPATVAPQDDTPGMIFYGLMMLEGVRWLILEHGVFAVILLLWSLALWACFGGAMYRIAAIQAAREEKISVGQSLTFSRKKFLSFLSAPLIPIAIVVVIALLLSVGGLIGAIPAIGEFVMGLLFAIAIAMGLAAAFMIIGLLAGGPLLYPTIAVEGSDSFDAISRSFSYIYGRPFRTVLYGVIAAIYGMITYLFVRLFAWLALVSVHSFVKWGVFTGGHSLSSQADKLDVLWARPTFWNLYEHNWVAANGWQAFCGFLIAIWVNLVVAAVAAYLISYFVSSSTIIYYLLRQKVDATDLDDVYVEEEVEEDLVPPTTEEAESADEQKEQPPAQEESAEAEEPQEEKGEDEGEPSEESSKEEDASESEDENEEDKDNQ